MRVREGRERGGRGEGGGEEGRGDQELGLYFIFEMARGHLEDAGKCVSSGSVRVKFKVWNLDEGRGFWLLHSPLHPQSSAWRTAGAR